MNRWTSQDIPEQTGRVALVTGANSGLGLETAKALAGKGAKVLMAARNAGRLERAMSDVRAGVPDADIEAVDLDLASLESIKQASEDVAGAYDRLDLLILNAGIMAVPKSTTADGFETQFGTNHLGHFALTGRLLDKLLEVEGSRIVVVSSDARRIGRIDFSDLHGRRRYHPWLAYGQSKLANLIFAETLDRKLKAKTASTVAVAAHPGYAATNLQAGNNALQSAYLLLGNKLLAQPAAAGAWPQLYAATMPDVSGGELYGPSQLGGMRGYPRRLSVESRARNVTVGDRLWDVSAEQTEVDFACLS